MKNVYIGTSGFYYEHWKGVFYPEKFPKNDWLIYYSKYFDTVEINSSFYHTVNPSTYKNWFKKTSDKFNFCLKGPRYITHIKRLSDPKPSLRTFYDSFSALGSKANIILWQFSKSFRENPERLETFLKEIEKFNKKLGLRQALEFRNKGWFSNEIYRILKKYNSCSVFSDYSPDFPKERIITADFAYLRFHGGGSLYASNYKDKELKEWALKIKKLRRRLDVYCYFNNDSQGFAVKNALFLKKIVGG